MTNNLVIISCLTSIINISWLGLAYPLWWKRVSCVFLYFISHWLSLGQWPVQFPFPELCLDMLVYLPLQYDFRSSFQPELMSFFLRYYYNLHIISCTFPFPPIRPFAFIFRFYARGCKRALSLSSLTYLCI